MAIKCPQGHWYEPESSGGAEGRCPLCATQTQNQCAVSDDDVLAIIDMPDDASRTAKPPDAESAKPGSSSAIMRRKKVCPECSHEASFSFVYCPRCGAPLKLATVVLRKS